MTPTRITPVILPLDPTLAQKMARLIPPGMPAPNLFLSVARNAQLFGFMVDSGWIGPTGLLDRGTLLPDVRETLILRTCVATRNDYEFNLHVQTISARMGLSDDQIQDIRAPDLSPGLWRTELQAVCVLADALVRTLDVADTVYERVRAHFTEEQMIEMTQLIGLYTGVAMMVGLVRPQFDRYRPEPVRKAASP